MLSWYYPSLNSPLVRNSIHAGVDFHSATAVDMFPHVRQAVETGEGKGLGLGYWKNEWVDKALGLQMRLGSHNE
eukprot:746352-Amorphochlora_amoeboformis.AAC.1